MSFKYSYSKILFLGHTLFTINDELLANLQCKNAENDSTECNRSPIPRYTFRNDFVYLFTQNDLLHYKIYSFLLYRKTGTHF